MKATVNVLCYKSKTLKNGEHPLMVCVCKNRKRRYISLGVSVKPQFWDFEKSKPKRNYPNREQLNKLISETEQKYVEQVMEFSTMQRDYTATTLVETVDNASRNVAVRKMRQGITTRRQAVLILTVLYNVPFVLLGIFLFKRYGNMDCDTAFAICFDDLNALGTHLDIPTNMPYYKKSWTEYYIVNLIIFVVLYPLALFANWWIKRIIKKHA